MNENNTNQILADNLRAMMKFRQFRSVNAMCSVENFPVTARTIGHILNQTASPSLDTLDSIADFFGISTWVFLVDGIDPAAMDSDQLAILIGGYIRSDDKQRDLIARTAQNAATATINTPLMPASAHRYVPRGDLRKSERG